MRSPFDDFDREFSRMEKSAQRTAKIAMTIAVVWILFMMGAIGTVVFLLGRWLGTW